MLAVLVDGEVADGARDVTAASGVVKGVAVGTPAEVDKLGVSKVNAVVCDIFSGWPGLHALIIKAKAAME